MNHLRTFLKNKSLNKSISNFNLQRIVDKKGWVVNENNVWRYVKNDGIGQAFKEPNKDDDDKPYYNFFLGFCSASISSLITLMIINR